MDGRSGKAPVKLETDGSGCSLNTHPLLTYAHIYINTIHEIMYIILHIKHKWTDISCRIYSCNSALGFLLNSSLVIKGSLLIS